MLFTGLLLAALLCGCGPSPQLTYRDSELAESDPAAGSELQVSLRLFASTDRGEHVVGEGETLHSGDRIFALVRASQQAYLYVVLFSADGAASVLFPEGEVRLAPAGCTLRLPQSGTLYLQDPTGVENLHVVASSRPLQQADRRLCEQLRLPCAEPPFEAAARPGACVASGKGQKTKGVISAYKLAKASANGVASLRLPIQHAP